MNTFLQTIEQSTLKYTQSKVQLQNDWNTLTLKFQDWKALAKNAPITKQSSKKEINRAKQALLPEIQTLETLYKSQGVATTLINEIEEAIPKWTYFATSIANKIKSLNDLSCATTSEEVELGKVNQFINEMNKTKKIMKEHIENFSRELPTARTHVTTQFKAVTASSWGIFDSLFAWPSFEDMIAKCHIPLDEIIKSEEDIPHDEKKKSASTESNIAPSTQPSISATKQPSSTTSTAPASTILAALPSGSSATGNNHLTLPLTSTSSLPTAAAENHTKKNSTSTIQTTQNRKVIVTKKDSDGISRPIHQITRQNTTSLNASVPSAASE